MHGMQALTRSRPGVAGGGSWWPPAAAATILGGVLLSIHDGAAAVPASALNNALRF